MLEPRKFLLAGILKESTLNILRGNISCKFPHDNQRAAGRVVEKPSEQTCSPGVCWYFSMSGVIGDSVLWLWMLSPANVAWTRPLTWKNKYVKYKQACKTFKTSQVTRGYWHLREEKVDDYPWQWVCREPLLQADGLTWVIWVAL